MAEDSYLTRQFIRSVPYVPGLDAEGGSNVREQARRVDGLLRVDRRTGKQNPGGHDSSEDAHQEAP